MNSKSGFTLIETTVVVAFLSLVIGFIFVQKSDLDALHRDSVRKATINAIYYSLEEDFYKANNYYPEQISPTNLPTVDETLWTDPDGFAFSSPLSSYTYTPANCVQGRCAEYTLKATLEKESTFVKNNRS